MKQFFDDARPCFTSMQVRVFFGTPSNKCAGSGVCKMLPLHLNVRNGVPCPSFTAQCSYDGQTFSLLVLREQFNGQQLDRWFAKDCFVVEESFRLPRWVVKQLGLNQWVIPAGDYPFRYDTKAIEVNLRLCELETTVSVLNTAV